MIHVARKLKRRQPPDYLVPRSKARPRSIRHLPWISSFLMAANAAIPVAIVHVGYSYFNDLPTWPLDTPTLLVFLSLYPVTLAINTGVQSFGACTTRFKRKRRGNCPTCNHDRSGLSKQAPCAECGDAA